MTSSSSLQPPLIQEEESLDTQNDKDETDFTTTSSSPSSTSGQEQEEQKFKNSNPRRRFEKLEHEKEKDEWARIYSDIRWRWEWLDLQISQLTAASNECDELLEQSKTLRRLEPLCLPVESIRATGVKPPQHNKPLIRNILSSHRQSNKTEGGKTNPKPHPVLSLSCSHMLLKAPQKQPQINPPHFASFSSSPPPIGSPPLRPQSQPIRQIQIRATITPNSTTTTPEQTRKPKKSTYSELRRRRVGSDLSISVPSTSTSTSLKGKGKGKGKGKIARSRSSTFDIDEVIALPGSETPCVPIKRTAENVIIPQWKEITETEIETSNQEEEEEEDDDDDTGDETYAKLHAKKEAEERREYIAFLEASFNVNKRKSESAKLEEITSIYVVNEEQLLRSYSTPKLVPDMDWEQQAVLVENKEKDQHHQLDLINQHHQHFSSHSNHATVISSSKHKPQRNHKQQQQQQQQYNESDGNFLFDEDILAENTDSSDNDHKRSKKRKRKELSDDYENSDYSANNSDDGHDECKTTSTTITTLTPKPGKRFHNQTSTPTTTTNTTTKPRAKKSQQAQHGEDSDGDWIETISSPFSSSRRNHAQQHRQQQSLKQQQQTPKAKKRKENSSIEKAAEEDSDGDWADILTSPKTSKLKPTKKHQIQSQQQTKLKKPTAGQRSSFSAKLNSFQSPTITPSRANTLPLTPSSFSSRRLFPLSSSASSSSSLSSPNSSAFSYQQKQEGGYDDDGDDYGDDDDEHYSFLTSSSLQMTPGKLRTAKIMLERGNLQWEVTKSPQQEQQLFQTHPRNVLCIRFVHEDTPTTVTTMSASTPPSSQQQQQTTTATTSSHIHTNSKT